MKSPTCIIKKITHFGMCFFLLSCNSQIKSNKELVEFVDSPESGLSMSHLLNGNTITCSIKPPVYILLKEKAKEQPLNDVVLLTKEIIDASDGLYFNLEISNSSNSDPLKSNLKSEQEYFSRLQSIEFDLPNYLTVVQGSDTLKNIFSVYERDYGVSGKILVNLAYKRSISNLKEQPIVITFKDNILGTGDSRFEFSGNTIYKVEQLKTKSI